MFKFADKVVDISNDISGKVLATALKTPGQIFDGKFPDELKNMKIFTPEELSILPDSDFALVFVAKDGDIVRRFPIPDADNAIVSAIYLKKVYAELPTAAAGMAAHNIMNVLNSPNIQYGPAIVHPITEGLYQIRDLTKNPRGNVYREPKSSEEDELRKGQETEITKEKTARAKLADSDFAFITEKAGRKHRLFPIDTVENVKRAEVYFDSNYKLFSPEQRNIFAKAVQAKATSLNHKTASQNLAKYASCRWSPTASCAIGTRIERLKSMNIKLAADGHMVDGGADMLKAMAGYQELKSLIGKTDIHKFASALNTLDKITGLSNAYGKSISDAFVSTYDGHPSSFTEKTALLDTLSTTFAGHKITDNMLKKLDIGDLGGIIDSDTLEEMQKSPISVFDSLPMPYKSAIVEALGIKSK